MRRILAAVLSIPLLAFGLATSLVVGAAPAGADPSSGLVISQYVEGSSNNKAIELQNRGGAPIDLADVTIELFNNGNTTANTTLNTLTGTLNPGDVYVIANSSASTGILAVADTTSGVTNFNGDDALRVSLSGSVTDVFGTIGQDPGSAWSANGVTTQNATIIRQCSVTTGNAAGFTDPSIEWDGFPQDDIAGLGADDCAAAPAGGLIFSQYIEGSSNNKAIEIENRGAAAVDLTTVTVDLFSNGATTPTNSFTPASGSLAPGEVFVIANASASPEILSVADVTSNVTFYNGDDALTLTVDGTLVDMFGTVGSDPGSFWSGGGISTQNESLCRLDSITEGNPTGFTDPSLEYTGAAIDTTDGLGAADCTTPIPTPSTGGLIISQYVEGSSFNKALELENRSDATIDLSTVDVSLYSNGAAAPSQTATLTGSLPVGGVFVIANPSADASVLSIADLVSGSVANWNGDDAITVSVDGTVVDMFGTVGEDPGSAWTGGGLSTQNQSLCRLDSITEGNPTGFTDPSLEYTGTPSDTFLGLGSADCTSPIPEPSDGGLVFSQYLEGSSNNKAIELENRSSSTIDLTTVTVSNFNNGATTANGSFTPASGSLAPGEVYVIANPSASAAILSVADATSTVTFFNGDDALTLSVDGTVVDMFGTVGVDPGSEWSGGGIGTANQTLCRKDAITEGNPTGFTDPSIEWDGFPVDTTDGLGAADCSTPITDPDPDPVFIHDVQGSGSAVAIAGPVIVSGIVTSLFEDADVLDGFFVQEEDADADADPATSEGIFVFCRGNCPGSLAPGDGVTVSGDATEFFGMSQIDASGGTTTIDSTGNPLPTAVVVDLPASGSTIDEATFESIEGMLVTFPDTLAVSEYFQLARFGQLVLTETSRPFQFTHTDFPSEAGYASFLENLATRRIILDDNNNDQNDAIFDTADEAYYQADGGLSNSNVIRGGDTITGLTAVMHWSFAGSSGTDAWRLRPIPEVYDYSFTSVNPRTSSPDDVGGRLTAVSFNVLNYFTTIDTGADICGPAASLGCRGAHSAAEFERQEDKIVSALIEIDADIVGLVEIENNASASLQALTDALNAVAGAGTYAYVDTGTIGGDAIKVGLLYQPATVTPVGDFAILDSSVDPAFIDTKNRPMLTQTFEEVSTGAKINVSVNHLKSKGSSCSDVGDPDSTDGSANCNGVRTAAAQAIVDFLASDPTGQGDPDHLILGDLNAYKKETPITTLTGAGYTDLIELFEGNDAYSFVFDGQLGYLDYALANGDLLGQITGVDEWHINADEINIYDYNDNVQDPGEASFERISEALPIYAPDAFRSSDHDPVIVGIELTAPEPSFECGATSYTVSELEDLGYNVILGTDKRDKLRGTNGPDAIFGFGARDIIYGRGGDDLLCGGNGRDWISGGNGADIIEGEAGNDTMYGGRGDDTINGGSGRWDWAFGGRGFDTCTGSELKWGCEA